MNDHKRFLVLGTSRSGGDWPPSVSVAQGLRARGHALRYFADATIQSAVQHLDIPVVVPAPDRELAAYLAPWLARVRQGEDPWGVATFASGRFLQDQFGHRSGLGGRP